jgi:hypothetical protein
MAVANKKAVKSTEKLTVAKRLGPVFLSVVSTKKNTNGNDYIATPHGAVYANLAGIEPGLHTAVELSNGAIALNGATTEEVLGFLNDKKGEYPNLSIESLREMYGI